MMPKRSLYLDHLYNDEVASTAVLQLQLKEARAEIEQLKALLTPQPSDLDMAISMLATGIYDAIHGDANFYDVCNEVLDELKRVRTVQNVKRGPES